MIAKWRKRFTVQELATFFGENRRTLARELDREGVDLRSAVEVINYIIKKHERLRSGYTPTPMVVELHEN